MATICKEILTRASPQVAWDAIRDVGALHTRLVPGFVTNTALDRGARTVTFATGVVVREPIVTIDDARRRLVWSAQAPTVNHYQASQQVLAEGHGARIVWIADFLPDSAAEFIEKSMAAAFIAMQRTLDGPEPDSALPDSVRKPVDPAVEEEPHLREFDFWLGGWEVTDPSTGERLGRSRVDAILGGRVLHEHWWGADGNCGESFNVFDKDRGCWHQSWVGEHGTLLLLDGGMREGAMHMQGASPDGERQRIRWWPQGEGGVLQLWESSRDAGASWMRRFKGLYRSSGI